METKINVTKASEEEKNRLVKFLIDNIRKDDLTFTEDEEIDTFLHFSKTFRDVQKIEVSFNEINRTLFSVIRIQDVEEDEIYFDDEAYLKNKTENCYIMQFYHSYFQLINGEIEDITLDDYIRLGNVIN